MGGVVRQKFSLISKANRKLIYEYLFREGVIVVPKDAKLPTHPDIDVPNLHVMMSLRSLKSKAYVDEIFSWQHHYYVLKNEGIEFLRETLNLPASVFPQTVAKRTTMRPPRDFGGERQGKDGFDSNWRNDDRPRGGRGRGFARPQGEGYQPRVA